MHFVVTNQKGGPGKTTVTVHAACWLSERGLRLGVIDADGQAATTNWMKEAAPSVTTVNVPDAAKIEQAIEILRPHVDVIISDSPPGLDARAQTLLRLADQVIIPTGPSSLDVNATMQAIGVIEAIAKSRGAAIPGWLVLNRKREGTNSSEMAQQAMFVMGERAGLRRAKTSLGLREAFAEAHLLGRVVARLKKGAAAAAAEIDVLFSEVFADVIQPKQAECHGVEVAVASGLRAPRSASAA